MNILEQRILSFLKDKHGKHFAGSLNYYFNLHFESLDLKDRSVLEIGAGSGYMSALCLARGASRVVALDPESAGSTKGINKQFVSMNESVGLGDGIKYLPIGLDEFISNRKEDAFDYILMCNVINHIDEDAVTRLHLPDAPQERNLYIRTFKKIHELLTKTGILLISDAGRTNLWHSLGLCFPTCRNINWNIHQNPAVWTNLLSEAGFASPAVKWLALYSLRHLKFIVSHKWTAQCLNSYFLIRAEKRTGDTG